jgi:hypothetical protein
LRVVINRTENLHQTAAACHRQNRVEAAETEPTQSSHTAALLLALYASGDIKTANDERRPLPRSDVARRSGPSSVAPAENEPSRRGARRAVKFDPITASSIPSM